MKTLIAFLILIVSVHSQLSGDSASINPVGCGKRIHAPSNKIINGVKAQVGDWGWMIGLNWHNQQNSHFCGGVLINSQWVLSAGHCFYGIAVPHYYNANIGFYDRNRGESWSTTRQIEKIFIHQSYEPNTYANDIALLKLVAPVTYSKYIVPACLPAPGSDFTGQLSWSTGWGNTVLSMNAQFSRDLLEVCLPILSDAACVEKFSHLDISTGFCAGEEGANKDTCGGDSGGPLVVNSHNGADRGNWTVAGLTSFGYGCGDGGVVTRISNYIDWIKNHIENN